MLNQMTADQITMAWTRYPEAIRSPGFQPVKDAQAVIVWYNNGTMSRYIRPAKAWRFWTGGRDWWQKPLTNDRLYIDRYVTVSLNMVEEWQMRMTYSALGLNA